MYRGLFSQIIIILLAAGIAFSYIKPTFDDIGKMQDDITTFKTERQKVDNVNNKLSELIDRLNGVPEAEQRKLLTYIPDEVDEIAVPRVLQIIAKQSGVLFTNVTYGGVDQKSMLSNQENAASNYPVPHTLTVAVEGTYQQIKSMITMLEENEYPLEVSLLDITVLKDSFLAADMTIVTYSHKEPAESKFNKR